MLYKIDEKLTSRSSKKDGQVIAEGQAVGTRVGTGMVQTLQDVL